MLTHAIVEIRVLTSRSSWKSARRGTFLASKNKDAPGDGAFEATRIEGFRPSKLQGERQLRRRWADESVYSAAKEYH